MAAALTGIAGCAAIEPASVDADWLEAETESDVPHVADAVLPDERPRVRPQPGVCPRDDLDGVWSGAFELAGPSVPAAAFERRVPVARHALYSMSNAGDLYHYTVEVPRGRAGQWWFLRVGDRRWSATAENFADERGSRRVSFYVDDTLADAISCTLDVARQDRAPFAEYTASVSSDDVVRAHEPAKIRMHLRNDGASPLGISLGSPDADGIDGRFTFGVRKDGVDVPRAKPRGWSGRPFVLPPGESTIVTTDLRDWMPLAPGEYEVEVAYDLDFYGPWDAGGRDPRDTWWTFAHAHEWWDAEARGVVRFRVEPG